MDEHVGKVIGPELVLDCVAVLKAHTVVCRTFRALFEQVQYDFIAYANTMKA